MGAPEAAPPWSLTSALLTAGFAFIAMIVGATVIFVWAGTSDYAQLAGWTLGGILIVIFIWQTRRSNLPALRLSGQRTPILFAMFIALGCAIALDLLSLAVTHEFLPKPEFLGLDLGALGALQWAFIVIFMVLVQPIAEGLVFRGMVLPALRVVAGSWGGILLAAILSGIFHWLIYPPNYNTLSSVTPIWYGLVIPVLEALVFNSVRAVTGSTRTAIAAQIAFGVFAVIKLLSLIG